LLLQKIQRNSPMDSAPWSLSSPELVVPPGCALTTFSCTNDPVTGRWLPRDPIGENGGMNLYVCDYGINEIDYLGLQAPANQSMNRSEENRSVY
jgi:hypothetical protein